MMETPEEQAIRWFSRGMSDRERIEHLMEENGRLRDQIKKLASKLTAATDKQV